MNAGLWLLEPDLDAMTWLVRPAQALAFRGESVRLGPRTWSPINTQNTALHRDLLAAYYYLRMNPVAEGLPIDRFGDIFSGYFCQACMHHLGDSARVGTPVADHRRNSHHYLRDAALEMAGICIIEELADWLTSLKLQGSSYSEAYCSLADAIDELSERSRGFIWTPTVRSYFHSMADCMRRWVRVSRQFI
jgi:hypothetical protein